MVSVKSFLTTLLIDIIVLVLMIAIYLIFRRYRSKRKYDENSEIKQPILSESESDLVSLHTEVWQIPLRDMAKYCGLEGRNYLILHKYFIILLSVMVCIDIPVLIPLYSSGNEETNHLERIGIANILFTEVGLSVPIVFIFINSILTYGLIYEYLKETNQRGIERELLTVDKYTIEVFGLPQHYTAKQIQPEFKKVFQDEFEEAILEGYVVPDYTDAYIDMQKLQKIQLKLDHYNSYVVM